MIVGPNTCLACRLSFGRHDRIIQVKIVAGIGYDPRGAGETVYLCDDEEYAHKSCYDRVLDERRIELINRRPIVTDNAPLKARTPDTNCAQCKRRWVRGDRIVPIFIVEGEGIDPETRLPAVQCSAEYELAHFNCEHTNMGGTP